MVFVPHAALADTAADEADPRVHGEAFVIVDAEDPEPDEPEPRDPADDDDVRVRAGTLILIAVIVGAVVGATAGLFALRTRSE